MNLNSRIRILFTHRELDSITFSVVQDLAKDPDFCVYITTDDQGQSIWQEEGITYLPVPPISSKVVWALIRRLRSYNQQYRFDMIYSPSSSGLSNVLLATWGSKTINIAYRGTGAKISRLDPTYYLGVLNPRVKHIVCETEHIYQYLAQFISERKLSVATKPYDISWVEEAKRDPRPFDNAPQGSTIFVSVSNTKGRPYKGLRTLIEAVNLLHDPRLRLMIVGDYDMADYDLAMNGPCPEAFLFTGVDSGVHRIAAADVYVLPSYRDASPRVIREAMALGVPTIVTDIPGSRDLIIPDSTGLLVRPRDAEDLARRMLWMLEHPKERRRMGEKGRERIISDFSVVAYIQIFKRLFRRLTF